jgi:hypothetical protein
MDTETEPFVVIPSYRRAGRVATRKLVPGATLAVHEFEASEYESAEGGDLLVLSDDLRGNMAKVRNAILTEGFKRSRWVMYLDDDIVDVGKFRYDQGDGRWHHVHLDSEDIALFIANGFVMAEDVGSRMWGMQVSSDPKFYREYSPLTFLSPVLGTFCGVIDNPLRYDERMGLNEDYDYFLQQVQRYHRVLRFGGYYYRAGHLTDSGGCGSWRTVEEERWQAELMLKKWGSGVVSYDLSKSTNPRIRVPLKGT